MSRLLLIFLSLFLLGTSIASAQQGPDGGERAFQSGEKLDFVVSYRAKLWPNTDMGKVSIKVTDDIVDGRPALKIEAYATVMGMFRWFFKMDDYYSSWLDKSTGLPLKATSDIREGGYRFSSIYDYDWNAGRVNTRYRNHKRNPDYVRKSMALPEGAMDGVSLFYTLRSDDIASYTIGEESKLELVLEDTVRTIRYKYLGPDVIDVSGLGSLSTLKFSCQIATSAGESFEDGSEFFLWITNDRNRVPVFIESPIRVGSIRGRLIGYNNLKYTQGSVLR